MAILETRINPTDSSGNESVSIAEQISTLNKRY